MCFFYGNCPFIMSRLFSDFIEFGVYFISTEFLEIDGDYRRLEEIDPLSSSTEGC